jgi:hypothetical protein
MIGRAHRIVVARREDKLSHQRPQASIDTKVLVDTYVQWIVMVADVGIDFMTNITRSILFAVSMLAATNALAQDSAQRQPAAEAAAVLGGGTFFLESSQARESSFANYDVGGLLTINFKRRFAIEGEVAASLGVEQTLALAGVRQELTSPSLLHLAGNFVVYVPARKAVVPFVTAGIGGVMVSDRAELFIAETKTYVAGNIGGGIKWYGGRWGLRGDYRLLVVRSEEFVPDPLVRVRQPFFGTGTRYAHRVFGGVILKIS